MHASMSTQAFTISVRLTNVPPLKKSFRKLVALQEWQEIKTLDMTRKGKNKNEVTKQNQRTTLTFKPKL